MQTNYFLVSERQVTPLVVENEAFEGVKRIAQAVASDVELVTGKKPAVMSSPQKADEASLCGVLCATVEHSTVLDTLEKSGKISLDEIRGKREVFTIQLADTEDGTFLVIAGSDKRGTIYGMFTLSEYIGVTAMVYWGDMSPKKQSTLTLGEDILQTSKEPSVRYRGFFINDEWPCFGNWTTSHFGDFNADMYRHVFEFLLRMKGNYLWPAMWSASFPLDGPGSANEELADIYGVVMGYSHHEPCLRASEEWDKVRGPETKYGNEWNFYTNEQGLLNYWEDALIRSGKYENLITIGMRGERDTSMLGENATVEENVNLLKDIIRKQRGLIKKHVNEDLSQVPQLLALYKEVEQYFYGTKELPGLKDWEELDGVICMLCDDNFGYLRTLPTEEIRNHKGGFGMYYHFDYHGGPVSYEWIDSTSLIKTWEQMCEAYEFGIRDAWIVNVGDLKLHEVPLSYFLTLAYDFDKWGSSNPNSAKEYRKLFVEKNFPQAGAKVQEKIATVWRDYVDITGLRRPESLHAGIYHPCHYNETDRMIAACERVEKLSTEVMEALCKEEQEAYYSMFHFSAMAGMNLVKMHLYAGKNAHYANQGRPVANRYADLVKECLKKDKEYADEFGVFKDKKWDGMQLAAHIGFTKWNEDGWRNPVISYIEPVNKPRMSVSRADDTFVAVKNYGEPMSVLVKDFCDAGCEQVEIELSNDGVGSYHFEVEPKELPDWLQVSEMSGEVECLKKLTLCCKREKLTQEKEEIRLLISDGDTVVAVDVAAGKLDEEKLPKNTFLPQNGRIVMNARHFASKKDVAKGSFAVIDEYGKYGFGVKVFPSTAAFTEAEDKPGVTYQFYLEQEGDYKVELLTAPNNSVENKKSVSVMVDNNRGIRKKVTLLPDTYRAGENSDPVWAAGVLDQIHCAAVELPFESGVQKLTIEALDPGVVLEMILISPVGQKRAAGYLGPKESALVQ